MITIIGAGMAGLLAAKMLKHRSPVILEKQSELPNNHSAVLRFRSSIVGDVTGIPFRKVNVLKATLPWLNPIADALAYANKNTGTYLSNRSIPHGIEAVERYIAPPDFIEQMAAAEKIYFGWDASKFLVDQHEIYPGASIEDCPIISTIPMPALMDILQYPGERPQFKSVKGRNIVARVKDCDAYVSLHVPDPGEPYSRISITGDEIIVEMPNEDLYGIEMLWSAAQHIGIGEDRIVEERVVDQQYAKIQECDDELRKRFIAWASDEHNIYSLGRFACWRPRTLLDDLVQDVRLIDKWIGDGKYGMRKHR